MSIWKLTPQYMIWEISMFLDCHEIRTLWMNNDNLLNEANKGHRTHAHSAKSTRQRPALLCLDLHVAVLI